MASNLAHRSGGGRLSVVCVPVLLANIAVSCSCKRIIHLSKGSHLSKVVDELLLRLGLAIGSIRLKILLILSFLVLIILTEFGILRFTEVLRILFRLFHNRGSSNLRMTTLHHSLHGDLGSLVPRIIDVKLLGGKHD